MKNEVPKYKKIYFQDVSAIRPTSLIYIYISRKDTLISSKNALFLYRIEVHACYKCVNVKRYLIYNKYCIIELLPL